MKKTAILLHPGGGMPAWLWRKRTPLPNDECITPEYRLGEKTLQARVSAELQDCVDHHLSVQYGGTTRILNATGKERPELF